MTVRSSFPKNRLVFLWVFTFAIPAMAQDSADKAGKRFPEQYEVKSVKDIDYYKGDHYDAKKHKLDLYLPKDQKDCPVLFFVHGGGWASGDRNYFGVYSSIGRFFARRGIVSVVISYRLTPKVRHPGHIEDVARAFAWTYKNIEKHGGRKDRIFISGHSAGGHLVALLATNGKYLQKEGRKISDIRGVIPISGVFSLPGRMLSAIFTRDEKVRRSAAPLQHVKGGLPPFLILYADRDFPNCGKSTAEPFRKALVEKKVNATSKEIKKSNHIKILMSVSRKGDIVNKCILDFIAEHSTEK